MNRHETAHLLVFEALAEPLAHAYSYVPTTERHRLAEMVCDQVEHDALTCAQLRQAFESVEGPRS